MKLPKAVKVGGHVYAVAFPFSFPPNEEEDPKDASVGKCLHGENVIQVADRLAGTKRKLTEPYITQAFWHETLHAIDAVYNADKLDEDTTERLSQGLFQVLTDNFTIKPK